MDTGCFLFSILYCKDSATADSSKKRLAHRSSERERCGNVNNHNGWLLYSADLSVKKTLCARVRVSKWIRASVNRTGSPEDDGEGQALHNLS